jgi:sodium transport system permease protein
MSPSVRADMLRVLRWDLLLMLRDRKAIFFMIILPVALYPLIMWGSAAMDSSRQEAHAAKVLSVAGDPALDDWLRDEDMLQRLAGQLSSTGETDILAELSISETEATIRYRADIPLSRTARDRLKRVLERAQSSLRTQRFKDAGLDLDPSQVLKIQLTDTSSAADRAGIGLGKLIPLVLVFLAMGGGLHTALDLFTGERERGTLETLLSSRVSRTAVLGAKFLLVLIATSLTSLLALLSLGLCLSQGWFALPSAEVSALGITGVLWAGALAIPLLIQLSAGLVLLASRVQDFKTGQFLAVPAMLLAMVPASVCMMPGIELSALLSLVPITGIALTTQEVMLSSPRWGLVGLAVLVTLAQTGALLWIGVRTMSHESTILGVGGRGSRHSQGRYVYEAFGLFVLVLLLFWFVGQSAMTWQLAPGIVLTQVVLIGLPAVLAIKWLGLPMVDRLQLRRPALKDLGLGLVAGGLAPCLGDLIFQWQDGLIPVSTEALTQLEQALPMDLPLWALLGLIALLPAVCEELLFRGAILGLLRKSLGPVARCIVVAVLFGALHLMLMRILPTATLGLLLTAAAMRSRSLWIPMLMHLLNNGLAITAATLGWGGPADIGIGLQVLGAALAIAAVAGMGRSRG